MSKCVKEGILTKNMLLNKYSDTGGLMSEAEAKQLNDMYRELGDLQTQLTNLNMKSDTDQKHQDKLKQVSGDVAVLRRNIARVETNFSALLNHTADTRAQNKVITWYLLNLVKIEDNGVLKPFFTGSTFEERKESFYQMEEDESPILSLVYDKLTAFISFWYFSTNSSTEDFEELEKDIEEGNL